MAHYETELKFVDVSTLNAAVRTNAGSARVCGYASIVRRYTAASLDALEVVEDKGDDKLRAEY